MKRFVLMFLACCAVAWAQEVPLEDADITFAAHPPATVSVDFAGRKETAHYDFSAADWHKFVDACRAAAKPDIDPNDPYFQKVRQIPMVQLGDLKVWRLIEPDTDPAIVISRGSRTLADVSGKYLYLYLKTLHEVNASLDGSI
ncbi:MAG TPA: hypothetical protein VGO93_28205 [Candidatus Xenobia bacterium]|jgi:hypothetical protein